MIEFPTVERYFLVVLGGGLGSALRYWAAAQYGARPLTTFWVNITGSFFIGLLSTAVSDARFRILFGTGFLGGFTTFSTWQLEALLQLRTGSQWGAVLNLLVSTLAGLSAAAIGYAAGTKLR